MTQMRLTGNVVLITGGGAGLGLALARALVAEGARVVLAGRRLAVVQAAAAELGDAALAVAADISREADVAALFAAAQQRWGRVDVLVNNAAFGVEAPLESLALADWQGVLDTNLTGAFLCAREAFRLMKPQGGGRIINIGSISAQMPRANGSAYAATKWALDGLTRAWALEGRAAGIGVSILHPGGIATEFQGGPELAAQLGFAMMDPADVARAVVLMASLPADVSMLEATMLPLTQPYLGRG